MSIKRHTVSIKYAIEGIVLGFKTQPNFKIHILLSIIALFISYYLDISGTEFLIILLIIGLGLSIEFLNTAIEYTVDLLTDKHHLLAKFAKDCAAAGMLVFSLFASVIALVIFLPRLWSYI